VGRPHLFKPFSAIGFISFAFLLLGANLSAHDRELAVAEVVQSQAVAWNKGDAEAWGSAYTETSRFINILGILYDGRKANVARHAQLFETIFKGSHLVLEIDKLEFPSDDIALVDTILTLTGHQRTPPGIMESRQGELLTRMKYVVQLQSDGAWKIIAAQNTAISPVAVPRRK
jgi:uncharacterized protein (TIGR02246 family)